MKRLLTTALATVLVAGAFAQGTFTIRRPVDGSKVREVVKVRIPKNSIPEGGYIGVLVNGKFLEAVVPDVEGNDYVYNLDTKARKLEDGPTNIETVLYYYTQGSPMVLNRSSVNVVLDNSSSIQQSNPDGFQLRYKFTPGREYTYRRTDETVVSFVTQAQAQLGSRAAEIVLEQRDIRYLIAHHNNYGSEGLIRFQALPEKGKDYAYIITQNSQEPTKFEANEMAPIYMRVTNTGREVFSSWPQYFPLEGTSDVSRTDLLAIFPLGVLPSRRVEVGETWQAAIPMPNFNLETAELEKDFVTNLPGSATLEAVEWEQGFPCAKIRSSLSVGAEDLKNIRSLDGVQGDAQSLKIESVQWFALDRGIMIREDVRFTSEVLVEVGGGSAAGPASGGGEGNSPGTAGAMGVGPGGGGGRNAPPPVGGGRSIRSHDIITSNFFEWISKNRSLDFGQSRPGFPSGDDGAEGGQQGGPQGEGFGNGGRGGGSVGGTAGVKMILRQTSRWSTVLE